MKTTEKVILKVKRFTLNGKLDYTYSDAILSLKQAIYLANDCYHKDYYYENLIFDMKGHLIKSIIKTHPKAKFISPGAIIDSGNERENHRRMDISMGSPPHWAGLAYKIKKIPRGRKPPQNKAIPHATNEPQRYEQIKI